MNNLAVLNYHILEHGLQKMEQELTILLTTNIT